MDDCLTLAYAYAHLGLTVQVRVVELDATDLRTGQTIIHSSLRP